MCIKAPAWLVSSVGSTAEIYAGNAGHGPLHKRIHFLVALSGGARPASRLLLGFDVGVKVAELHVPGGDHPGRCCYGCTRSPPSYGCLVGGRAAEQLLSIAFSLFLLANSNDIMT